MPGDEDIIHESVAAACVRVEQRMPIKVMIGTTSLRHRFGRMWRGSSAKIHREIERYYSTRSEISRNRLIT